MEKRLNLAQAALQALQRLSYTEKGLSFKALQQLYISYVTAISNYGSPIW
jgi:hypothetical protein